MARVKNALTGYFVGDLVGEIADNELAKWISSVTDDSEEEVEDTAWYSGDGTPEEDIISVKKTYAFEGLYDDADLGMKFIADLEFETGEARKIWFKQVRTDGSTLEGPATVKEIKVTGGEASDYPEFSCSISWDTKPSVTPPAGP